MIQQKQNMCFCTLALGKKYRLLAQQLAGDLEKYAPGISLVIGTDEPKDFSQTPNVIAFDQHKQGILHCYNDKRFVLEKSLPMFPVVIFIDADTRIFANVPTEIAWSQGITCPHENLIEHVKKYTPERVEPLKKLALKLNISIENVQWIGESLYVITRNESIDREFIQVWGMIGKYLDLNRLHWAEGSAMGLAAAKVGLTINSDRWENLKQVTQHLDASDDVKQQISYWDNLKSRLDYHYRLNRERLIALKDFDFYYR